MNERTIKQMREILNKLFPIKIQTVSGTYYKITRFSNNKFKSTLLTDHRDMLDTTLNEVNTCKGNIPKKQLLESKNRYGTHIFLQEPLINSAVSGCQLTYHSHSILNFAYIHEDAIVWANAVSSCKENLIRSYTSNKTYNNQEYIYREDVNSNSLVLIKYKVSELAERIIQFKNDNGDKIQLEEIYEFILLVNQLDKIMYPKKRLKYLNLISYWGQKLLIKYL